MLLNSTMPNKIVANSDQNYYEDNYTSTNCGSYAFNIKDWYDADRAFENENGYAHIWMEELFDKGLSDLEVSNLYIAELLDGIVADFKGEVQLLDSIPILKSNEELIAFRAFCRWDEIMDEVDFDWHFKVYRDGHWREKNGSGLVSECRLQDWEYEDEMNYISKVYFFKKIYPENLKKF